MATNLHVPCSWRKPDKHEAFSEELARKVHNLCMSKKKDDPIAKEMGRRLAESRTARGWTQAQLAKLTGWRLEDAEAGKAKGISPSRIGNYEQGTRRFKNEEAEILGEVFGLPAAYFLVVLDEHEAEVIIAMRKRVDRTGASQRRRRQQ